MSTKISGSIGENIAVDVLKEKGYKILERNYEANGCEVDVICECYTDENGKLIKFNFKNKLLRFFRKLLKIQPLCAIERTIAFVEVKRRSSDDFGAPEEAVTPYKAGRYVTAAKAYISQNGYTNDNVRFDIFAIDDNGYRHIENAFGANDAKYPRNV